METLEDEYCPDCGKYGTHTCKGKQTLGDILEDIQDITGKFYQDIEDFKSAITANKLDKDAVDFLKEEQLLQEAKRLTQHHD